MPETRLVRSWGQPDLMRQTRGSTRLYTPIGAIDDLPPGVQVASDNWPAWCAGMERLASQGVDLRPSDYERWDSGRVNTLATTVRQILVDQS